ncbi:AbrB/MazE/SpoVT family DNA-binding domain-containing protein [Candidatus Aerophobetes bacterium]|nr:AbrB/MazE/SpoVT family DNA-binding domain-containing protein [Candidatus Aerophobetes bacterium]
MLAKRTFKNQITIPKEIISKFGDVEYFDVMAKEGEIVLRPVKILPQESRLAGIREKIKSLGLTEKDIEEAIKWARKEKV